MINWDEGFAYSFSESRLQYQKSLLNGKTHSNHWKSENNQLYIDCVGVQYVNSYASFVSFPTEREKRSLFLFFFIWFLWPFQEYFTYIEPIVHQRWTKTGGAREKTPDHP